MLNQPTESEFPRLMRKLLDLANNDKTLGELLVAMWLRLATLDVIPISVATELIFCAC